MQQEWLEILKTKRQTFSWNEAVPDQSLIDSILEEVHNFSPSKQNLCRYQIKVVKNFENEQRKLDIYKSTDRKPTETGIYNSQVLAPYLFAIFLDKKTGAVENIELAGLLDIGLVSCFIAYSAIAKGLDIGFCQCINKSKDLQKHFNNRQPYIFLGVGYKSEDPSTYICPITNRRITRKKDLAKPVFESYISYL